MITVVDWVDEDDIPIEDQESNTIGWMGGWFNAHEGDGHRWVHYVRRFKPEAVPYVEAVRREVLEHELKYTGENHQHNSCTPKFSDGKYLCLSYRAWGDLMAAIWSEKDNKDYSYMDFYM